MNLKDFKFVHYLYSKPVVSIKDVVGYFKITKKSAIALVNDFEQNWGRGCTFDKGSNRVRKKCDTGFPFSRE
jgi:hypothetical protein